MLFGTCLSLVYESAMVAPNFTNEEIMRAQPAMAIGALVPADAMATPVPSAQPAALKAQSIAAFFMTAFFKTPAGSSTFVNATAAS